MELKNLIETQQLSQDILFHLFKSADNIRQNPEKHFQYLKGKILTSLFYEPSTRTRLSFESAILRLGGKVIGTENAKEFSSASKGESIEDSIRVLEKYSDIVVIRHPQENTCLKATKVSKIPIINAGEGKGQHPTQALLDLYTIYREFQKLENLKIAIVGDLASGRTARSLCYLLGKFPNNEITFVSPENLKMKQDIKDYLTKHKIKFSESENLNNILENSDIIYMTRIQKERLLPEEYEKAKGKFIINKENLKLIKPKSRILHPLPHVEEINLNIETEKSDSRICYFRQAENGLWIRMALLKMLLGR